MQVRWWCSGWCCCGCRASEDLGVDQRLSGRAGPVDPPLLLECCLSRGETGDRHAERRAGHVIQARVVTELHRRRLAAVLSTDADLELGPRSPAELDRQLDELADAFLIEHLERVVLQDAVLHIERQEPARVGGRQAERGLREGVCPEGEKLCGLG